MSKQFRPIVAGLAVEFSLWCIPAGLFLFIYIWNYRGPTTAIWPHYLLVSQLLLTMASLRFLFIRWIGSSAGTLVGALCSSSALLLLAVYYSATLIGLDSWGRVISLPLITAYAAQIIPFLQIIGFSPIVVAISGLISCLALWAVMYLMLKRWDWIPHLLKCGSPKFFIAVFVLIVFIIASSAWKFIQAPAVDSGEPISLTLSPNFGKLIFFQSNKKIETKKLDSIERSARANYHPVKSAQFKNVILIVVDALRADHLSVNGYLRKTTPYLEKLNHAGKLDKINRMYSVCAESSCGLSALASSRNIIKLPSQPFTLPEILRLNGYKVHMLLSGDHTNFYGLREAYGQVDSYFDGSMSNTNYMNDDQLIIDKLSHFPPYSKNPTFFQFHLMSTHALGKRDPKLSPFIPESTYAKKFPKPIDDSVNAETKQSYLNYYDNGVFRTDQMIKSILDLLDSKGYLEMALVVITSDHGELLGEWGQYQHSKTVHEEVLNIPFFMLRYGYVPNETFDRTAVASQIDIAPTILTEVGLPLPSSWSGRPLQRSKNNQDEHRYLLFQQRDEYGLIELGQVNMRWKYWIDAKSGKEQAYELISDPQERVNRISEIPVALRSRWRLQLIDMEIQNKELNSVLL
jgi:glucan phosphoethanolaminetransferase (alkaline phosphatase superfamily)